MKIGFDASVVFSSVGGTRVYATELLDALMELKPEWEYYLYARDDHQASDLAQRWSSPNAHAIVLRGSPNTWRIQASLPRRLSDDGIDLYHSLGYFVPLRWRGPRVVTVHDLNVYLTWRKWIRAGKVFQWADMALQIPLSVRAADRIITLSQASSDAIRGLFHIDVTRISVIPLAPDPYFDEPPLKAESDQATELTGGRPFVLFVGILSPQKNLRTLVRAFAESRLAREGYRLVLAGSDREGEGAALRETARVSGIEGDLVIPGFVTNAVLRALYHQALCLVLPSWGEGFGLPLVEAMASGTPIVAANVQALPEVVGDAGVLIDPHDVSSLARQLRRLSEDATFRDHLIRAGKTRRTEFSWRSAAEATARIYEEVLRTRR